MCTRYMYPLIVSARSLVYEDCVPTYCTGMVSSARGMCTHLLYRHSLQCTRYVYLFIVPAQSLTVSSVRGMCTYLLYRTASSVRGTCTHLLYWHCLQCMFTQSLYRNGLQSARYMYPLIVTVQSLVCEVCVPTYCTGTISSVRGMCTYLLYRYNLLCARYVYVPTYCTGTASTVRGIYVPTYKITFK